MNRMNLDCVRCALCAIALVVAGSSSAEYTRGDALNGTYIIGDTNADFSGLDRAMQAIDANGISGPVELLMQPGAYTTNVTIGNFTRLGDPEDWLTIASQFPNEPAVLEYEATSDLDNWLIRLDQAHHVFISDVIFNALGTGTDFANLLTLENESHHIRIENNEFNGREITAGSPASDGYAINTASGSNLTDIDVVGNVFAGGSGGVRMQPAVNGFTQNIALTDNEFSGQTATTNHFAVDFIGTENMSFARNRIDNSTANARGVRLSLTRDLKVEGNTVNMLGAGTGGVAMELSLTNLNMVSTAQIINNALIGAKQALYVHTNSHNIEIVNNTLISAGFVVNGTATYALEVASGLNSNIAIQNNIMHSFVSSSDAAILRIESTPTVTLSDNNVFFTQSTVFFRANGNAYNSLIGYQTATGLDGASLFKQINFVDQAGGDLHLTAPQYHDPDLITAPHPLILIDIDGEMRPMIDPLIGADDVNGDVIFAHGYE